MGTKITVLARSLYPNGGAGGAASLGESPPVTSPETHPRVLRRSPTPPPDWLHRTGSAPPRRGVGLSMTTPSLFLPDLLLAAELSLRPCTPWATRLLPPALPGAARCCAPLDHCSIPLQPSATSLHPMGPHSTAPNRSATSWCTPLHPLHFLSAAPWHLQPSAPPQHPSKP